MAAKKKVKKKGLKKAQVAETKDDKNLRMVERTAVLRMTINKSQKSGAEKVIVKKLGVSVFPMGLPLSSVRVKTHGTFNMGTYNSIQASVEIEDMTISHPQAREALMVQLANEALNFNAKLAQRVATRLFNQDLPTQEE